MFFMQFYHTGWDRGGRGGPAFPPVPNYPTLLMTLTRLHVRNMDFFSQVTEKEWFFLAILLEKWNVGDGGGVRGGPTIPPVSNYSTLNILV
jgi:hypothetical protein